MKNILTLTLSVLITVLAACGGGTSNAPPVNNAPPPVGGIGRTGLISLGPISTFGSVVVNGIRYDTSNATFTIDDAPGSESDLSVGQIVTVRGSIDDNLENAEADEVSFDDNVEGPVQSIDLTLDQLVVMGQLVLVGPDTSFDDSISPASLEGLSVGDIVEVSGLVAADGSISATRIELKPVGSDFEVHGTVSNLNPGGNMLFSINALVVDYSTATLDNFPGGQISEGDFVEAKGSLLNAAGRLVATSVELETVGIIGDEGERVEVEGFITRFVSAQDFDVSGVPITTNGATQFEGGTAADLGLNIKVEVEGDLDANNLLVAEKVDIRRARAVRATALLDSVDAANNSMIMLGITVSVDELTRLEDGSNAAVRPLTVSDLNAGDYLEVRGDEFPAGSGQILAGRIKREDPEVDTILQGFVESVTGTDITILGVTIDTSSAIVFRDVDDSVLTSAQFFALAGINSLVKATGTESLPTTITATEVELEFEN
jgi:Domain of unknown function (DUF5666)